MKYLTIIILLVLIGCQDDFEPVSQEVIDEATELQQICGDDSIPIDDYIDFVMDETCSGDKVVLIDVVLSEYFTFCNTDCVLDVVDRDSCVELSLACD